VAIEEGDLDGSKDLLDRALQFYADFPEALALRNLVESWSSATIPVREPALLTACDVELGASARDFLITREDGSPVSSRIAGERAMVVAEHTTRVCRMASATLRRAGLGPLRGGVVETQAGRTLLVSEARLILSASFDLDIETRVGVAQIERMRRRLAVDA
jgi:predicted regulator of Ras-like GTPase activity (Roadblock/LC7/MglB family)